MIPPFPFRPAIALSPLEGLTTPEIRDLFVRRGGLGLVCTEFVRIHQLPSEARLRQVVRRSSGVPLSVQLMGNDAELMGLAARLCASAGADVVDINLGCPTKRAVRGHVGSGLLRDHEGLRRVLDAMRSATRGLLSAKLRAGFDRLDDACVLGRIVEASGADFVVVHPRRRVDMYEGVADWRIVSELKRTLRIPVVGNGDTWYAADARRLREESGCDALMIGRPALRNPWIFRQLAELDGGVAPFAPAGSDVVGHVEELARIFAGLVPPRRQAGAIKEHLRYLGRAIPDDGVFMRAVLHLDDVESILEFVRRSLTNREPNDLDLAATSQYGLEQVPSSAVG